MPVLVNNNPNIVLIGSWNVGILNPNWFSKYFPSIVPDPRIEVDVTLGPIPEISFISKNIKISPTNNRLSLFAVSEDIEAIRNIIILVTGIFEKLPHTPIQSIGHNIAYSLSESESFLDFVNGDIGLIENEYDKILKGYSVVNRDKRHTLSFENHNLNITYGLSNSKNYVDFNFHYNVRNDTDLNSIVSNFEKNYLESKRILREIIK